MDRELINLLLLDRLDFFKVFIWFLGSSNSLGALWCYGEALGNIAILLTVIALELELGFLEVDLDAIFSELSIP